MNGAIKMPMIKPLVCSEILWPFIARNRTTRTKPKRNKPHAIEIISFKNIEPLLS